MTESNGPSKPNIEAETALPLSRRDVEQGLRAVHELLTAAQDEGDKAAACARTLAFLLVDKGVIQPRELEMMIRQVHWDVIRKPTPRVRLGSTRDKYSAAGAVDIDCPSLIPLCHGRCCTFAFFLTKQDLDEGIVRWDYGNPYWIKQGADGHCTHSDPVTRLCTVHAHRPYICRRFDCRRDKRIWVDFEARIPALPRDAPGDDPVGLAELLLHGGIPQPVQNWMDPEEMW